MVKSVIAGTLLSALVFLSVSFLSFINSSRSEFPVENVQKVNIGYPSTYLTQYWVNNSESNATSVRYSWKFKILFISCFAYWLIFGGTYVGYKYHVRSKARARRRRRRRHSSSGTFEETSTRSGSSVVA
jgi:hypothetical protein